MKVNLTIGIPIWLDKLFTWPLLLYRRLKFGYAFRRIYLGENEWTILDQQDYYRFGDMKWSVCGHTDYIYAGRLSKNKKQGQIKPVYLHREIMNAPDGLFVDHKNLNGLDNRRANLRLATRSQNCWNKKKRKNTSSKYIGVHFDKSYSSWKACISVNKKKIYLGRFKTEIDAACAYDEGAKKYHGEFARLNFPNDMAEICPT